MAANSFDKTSIGWELQQIQQRIGEWLEVKFKPALDRAIDAVGIPEWLWNGMQIVGWIVFGFVSVWLAWQIAKLLQPYIESWMLNVRGSQILGFQAEIAPTHTVAEWLQQAQKLQAQGNYGDACRALYMALLLRLSDAELIPSQASRTDREYLRLLQKIPQSQACHLLITTHEQLWFNDAAISAEMFERCQQAYRDVDKRLQVLQTRGTS